MEECPAVNRKIRVRSPTTTQLNTMKLIILGDVHGHWDGANATVHNALERHPDAGPIIQLGDLGDGWPTKHGFNRWKPTFDVVKHPIFVVDGNHENFDAIESGNINPALRWVPRGEVMVFDHKFTMFFGGATSPDRGLRTIGRSWWPQESITQAQVQRGLDYDNHQLTAMFCHERAECFPMPPDKQVVMWEDNCGRADRIGLEAVVRKQRPMFYFHGHWHWGNQSGYVIDGKPCCVIACPNINEQRPYWTVFDISTNEIDKNWSNV
jgi:Calcineurin-like phosphoesterase